MEFETNESSLLYLTNTISRTSAELQTCASGEPSVRPCPEPLRVSPVHYTQLICPDLDLSVSLSPAPPTDRRNRQVRFAMTPHISQLQCDPVTSQSNQPEGAELNTSLAYKAELQEVEEKQFDPEEAVKNRLQSSAFTKNHVELRASAGVNIPRCQQQYRELVSVDLSNDQLLERALQERPPLTSHSVSNGQKPLEAPDPMHFFSSHKMIRETLLLPGKEELISRGQRDRSTLTVTSRTQTETWLEEKALADMDIWNSSGWNGSDWDDWEVQSLFSHSELVIVTTLCVPLLLLGLLGNTLTVLVVWLRPQMRSTTYLYLSSMAVSDVLILLLMPLDLYKLWRYRPWLLGEATCKLSVFVGECCTFSSILHMTALGAERYLAVCFPLRARLLVTRRRVRMLLAGLWGVALLSAGPALALVGVEESEEGVGECRCTQYALTSGLLKAMLWLSNLYFICPVTVLLLLYGLIARRLRLRAHFNRDKSHRQTLRMMVVIVVAFVLCWLPFHVSRTLFSVSDTSDDLYYISQYLNLTSLVLFYVSAAVNPLLYNLMSARYRANVMALLRLGDEATHGVRHSHSSTCH